MQNLNRPRHRRIRFRLWRRRYLLLSVFMPLLLAGMAVAQKTATQAYQVKALFLFNFSQFVEWPAGAFTDPTSPLVIGILGEDPFGAYLDDLLAGERVNDHPLEVRRFSKVEDVEGCHILFISLESKDAVRDAVAALKSQSVLTVSDAADFTRQGGMVQFFIKENKIRIRIGLEPATHADLNISSKLLRLAEIDSRKKQER